MFRHHAPVSRAHFHDRVPELARLTAMVERLRAGRGPTWLAIIGQRKVGKTSLLLETQRRTGGPFVLLDLYERRPVGAEVFRTYALRVLDAMLTTPSGRSLEAAARDGRFAATLAGVEELADLPLDLRDFLFHLPDAELTHDAVVRCLDLPEALAVATGRWLVCGWDEFQELPGVRMPGGTDIMATMRSVWQRHERVAYVISGSEPSMLRELAGAQQSPFFQHFEVFELGPMAEADALALVAEASEHALTPRVARALYDLVGGHPFYLQVLGDALVQQGAPFDDDAIKHAVQRTLFSRTGRLALIFERRFGQMVGRSAYAAAALSGLAAASPMRLVDLSRRIGAPTGDTARYLQRLGDAVVKRPDGLYALADPVYGLWIHWRSPGGMIVPMTLLGDEGERRVASALAALGFDLVYQARASRGAFDLLATQGPNQLGVQVKRTALPLVFAREAWDRMESEGARFGWSWVLATVQEGDVRFLDPERARIRKTVRVHADAAIDNLPAWLDARP